MNKPFLNMYLKTHGLELADNNEIVDYSTKAAVGKVQKIEWHSGKVDLSIQLYSSLEYISIDFELEDKDE